MAQTLLSDKANYGIRITLRLSDEERNYLALRAEAAGCSLSQEARRLMFGGDDESLGGRLRATEQKDLERRKLLALESTKKAFKKIAESYTKMAEEIVNGPQKSAEIILRKLVSIEDMTVVLQQALNKNLSVFNEKEVNVISRNIVKSEEKQLFANTLNPVDFKLKYCYMERIMIMGFLVADAEEYEKNGVKRMRFGVICERKRQDKKRRVLYTVFSDRNDSIEYLKKGRQVFAEGNLEENDKGEKLVFATPDTIRLMGAE